MGKKKGQLLTEKEAVDLIGVNRVTLWRWAKKEILVPVRFGRTIRYKKSDIIEHAKK